MANQTLQRKRVDSQLKLGEVWRPVPSQPGVLASNLGRILSPPRVVPMYHGGYRHYITQPTFGCVSSADKAASHKRMTTMIRPNGCTKQFTAKVHRLVCEAFHGAPPFAGAVVIHLDEDAMNNRADNLKWGTQLENMNMPVIKAYHRSRVGENSCTAKGKAKRSKNLTARARAGDTA